MRADAADAEEIRVAEVLAGRLDGVECVVSRKVGETETLYGSVTSADVAESLAAQQIEIDKWAIQLAEPIKRLGEFAVPIRLHRSVTVTVMLRVVSDAPDGQNVETSPVAEESN